MIIRVDRCTTLGIKKFSTYSMQFQPKLLINNDLVPTPPPSKKEIPLDILAVILTLR